MPPPRVDLSLPHWASVVTSVKDLAGLLGGATLSFIDLAKGFQAAFVALESAAAVDGISSLRLRAVVKALDLKTPKNVLEAFVGMSKG